MYIRTPKELGAKIRDRRKQLGLGQAELAGRIGASRQWVIAVEHGRARAEVGLVLRALEALALRLATDDALLAASGKKVGKTPKVDIDAIVASARKKQR